MEFYRRKNHNLVKMSMPKNANENNQFKLKIELSRPTNYVNIPGDLHSLFPNRFCSIQFRNLFIQRVLYIYEDDIDLFNTHIYDFYSWL